MLPGHPVVATDFGAALAELDVHAAIQTAQALIRCVRDEQGSAGIGEEDEWEDVRAEGSSVLDVCVTLLKESMAWLRRDVESHEQSLAAHKQKWFSSWRAMTPQVDVETLHRHKRLFDMRLRMLLDIVAALPHASKTQPPNTPHYTAAYPPKPMD